MGWSHLALALVLSKVKLNSVCQVLFRVCGLLWLRCGIAHMSKCTLPWFAPSLLKISGDIWTWPERVS